MSYVMTCICLAGLSQDNDKVQSTAHGSHKDRRESSTAVETESQLFTALLSKVLPTLNVHTYMYIRVICMHV